MKSRSRHSSLDSDSLQKTLDTGKSLLLTQSFKPSFSLDDDGDDDDTNSNRNSSSSSNSSNYNKNNPYLVNPFETDESSAPTPRLEITITPPMILPQSPPPEKNNSFCYHLTNSFYNSEHIPPPPVPPQSTKPAYPKYARRTRV
jgi:hypothetical protein